MGKLVNKINNNGSTMSVPDQPWAGLLDGLDNILREISSSSWCEKDHLMATYNDVKSHFKTDLDTLDQYFMFAYDAEDNVQDLTDLNAQFLRYLYMMDRPVSLVSLAVHGLEQVTQDCPKDLQAAVLIAGVLGETEHDFDYHSNMHFRSVLIQTIRMIKVHNKIYAETKREFNDAQCALLIIAACIHDLGHDGKGNTLHGVFQQWRLELQSYEYAEPYLRAAGLDDGAYLNALKTILLCTDVNPLDDPRSPMSQMKAAYRFHFLGEKEKVETLNLFDEIDILEDDSSLTIMALVLHEADVATSAGLTYAISKFETIKYHREFGIHPALPSSLLNFLNRVCQRKMLSDAGQHLYGANLARIIALAEADVEAGNEPLPELERSEFWLKQATSSSVTQSKNH